MPANPTPIEPLLLRPKDAAKLLAISERTLWALTDRGDIHALKIGSAKRYALDELRRWIDQQGKGAGNVT